MNLNQLKIFYLVFKHGSLKAAASELNITQPAVSKAVQRLQEFYEVSLTERVGKKLALTGAGRAVFHQAEKIFNLEILIEDCIRGFKEKADNYLRIEASETFGAYYLPGILENFRRLYPEIKISVDIRPNKAVLEGVASMICDFGFISFPMKHREVVLQHVISERLVIISSPNHVLAKKKKVEVNDLIGQSIIMHEQGTAQQKAISDILGAGYDKQSPCLELSNNEAIKRAVASGVGIALISEKVITEELSHNHLSVLPLSYPPIIRPFFIAQHKRKAVSPTMLKFSEIVSKWASVL